MSKEVLSTCHNANNIRHSTDGKSTQAKLDPYVLPPWLRTCKYGQESTQAAGGSHNASGKVWLAPSVDCYGDVRLGEDVSVWFQCVLRGDVNYIEIGAGTNIQDATVVHVSNTFPCRVGCRVTVGHRALLHGCRVADDVLIGMGAIILTGASIGQGAVIAAGAVVKEGAAIPPFTLLGGVPAKKIRDLEPTATLAAHRSWAQKYINLAYTYKMQAK